jgi:hypothetical protein
VESGKVEGEQTKTEPEDRMNILIGAVFCLCDDMVKALHHYKNPQCQMTDAEVMTTGIVAALHNGEPVEFFLTPGDKGDTNAYSLNDFDLPDNARVTGDKAYTDYDV